MVMVAVPPKKVHPRLEQRWRRYVGVFVAASVFVLGIARQRSWTLSWLLNQGKINSQSVETTVTEPGSSVVQTKPQVQRETIRDTDVLFAEPSSKNVKGLLFVAHGCSHSHTDWFSDCGDCIGLPEERAIVQIGLNHGLVVVAISSSDRMSKCWNLENDIEPVGQVLQELAKRYQPPNQGNDSHQIPVFAFGASSGGAFVSGIATPLKDRFGMALSGFLSQIAARQTDEAALCQVYITMNGDPGTDARAQQLVSQLASTTTTATKVPMKHIRIPPLPILPEFFASRIPEITAKDSARMFQALRDGGLLDKGGYLLESPRRSNWRNALLAATPPIPAVQQDSLVADASSISEVMNVADGRHEMTRDGVQEALEFCLSGS